MLVPEGTWFDYWTGQRVELKEQDNKEMKGKLHLNPKLDEIPVFVRAGSIIPRQPLVQNTSETPNGPFELRGIQGPIAGEAFTPTTAAALVTNEAISIAAN